MVINIQVLVDNLSTIKKLIDILKMVDVEPLESIKNIRSVLQQEILSNYELVLETQPIETKKNIKNFIVNRLREILDATKSVLVMDIDTIKEYVKKELKISMIDNDKLEYVVDKIEDHEAFMLIGHKVSLSENMVNILDSLAVMKNIDNGFLGDDFGIMVEKFNSLLTVLDNVDYNDAYVNKDMVVEVGYEFDAVEPCTLKDVTCLKDGLINKISVLEIKVIDIKENLPKINANKPALEKIDKLLMNNIDMFLKGTINTETFEYNNDVSLSLLSYYITCIEKYMNSIINYINLIETFVVANNNVEDLVNVSYSIFNKSK